jgi:hypothetical protein
MHTAILTNRNTEISPGLQARIGGGFYLINIITGVFAIIFVRSVLFVPGDAAADQHTVGGHLL